MDDVGGFTGLRRWATRRRAERTLRNLRWDLESLRRDIDDVRGSVSRGPLVKAVARRAKGVSDGVPLLGRRRKRNPVAMGAPVVAVIGMAGLAVLLLWDDRRRAEMRRRLDDVASTVTSNRERAAEQPPVPSGRD